MPAMQEAVAEKKLKILFMNPIEETVWGGVEKWMTTVARALSDRGHWAMLSGRPDSLWMNLGRKAGLEVLPVEIKGNKNIREILLYAKAFKRYEIDLICLKRRKFVRIGGMASLITRKRPRPAVICREGVDSIHNEPRYRFTHKRFLDKIIVPAYSIRDELMSFGFIEEKKIAVIPNGIDPEPYLKHGKNPSDLRLELSLEGKYVICVVCRPNPEKGIETLLAAAKILKDRLPPFKILIVGEGRERSEFEARAKELGVAEEVSFLGFRTDVPDLLHRSDLFVLPSYLEGVPNALLEAMAAGKPIVATTVGDVPRMIQHNKEGVLVPPRNETELAKSIQNLIENRSVAAEMGRRAQDKVCREFGHTLMIERVEKVFRSEVERKRLGYYQEEDLPQITCPS